VNFEFDKILQSYVILICESWLKSTDIFAFDDFVILRDDRGDDTGHGGVLIMIRKSLSFTEFEIAKYKNIEAKFIEIFGNATKKIRLGVVYNPPSGNQEAFDQLSNLFGTTLGDRVPCIIVGDFNFPYINWNDLTSIQSDLDNSTLDNSTPSIIRQYCWEQM
jgi:exonuclease III